MPLGLGAAGARHGRAQPDSYDAYRQAAVRAGFIETPRWILSVLDKASGLTPAHEHDGRK